MTQVQNVFNMSDHGMKGTMSELERRKFTAEEGDHLTLLNGEPTFFISAMVVTDQQHIMHSCVMAKKTNSGAVTTGSTTRRSCAPCLSASSLKSTWTASVSRWSAVRVMGRG